MARKRYRVTGTQPIDGHKPGDEYSAAYPAAHERYLLAGGHLTLITNQRGDTAAKSSEKGVSNGQSDPDRREGHDQQRGSV